MNTFIYNRYNIFLCLPVFKYFAPLCRVICKKQLRNQRSDYVTRRFIGSKSDRISSTFTQTNLVSLIPSFQASSLLRVNFAQGRRRLAIHYIESLRCMQTLDAVVRHVLPRSSRWYVYLYEHLSLWDYVSLISIWYTYIFNLVYIASGYIHVSSSWITCKEIFRVSHLPLWWIWYINNVW